MDGLAKKYAGSFCREGMNDHVQVQSEAAVLGSRRLLASCLRTEYTAGGSPSTPPVFCAKYVAGAERMTRMSEDLTKAARAGGALEECRGLAAPAYKSLPDPRRRGSRLGPRLHSTSVELEVVTPTLGGGGQVRSIDEVEVIRPATVRGHLRFWWRALLGHEFATPRDLYTTESALWGRAADEEGGRSAVEVRIEVLQAGEIDDSNIDLLRTPGAYALWPARAERKKRTPPAPRRRPGTRFRLTLLAPEDWEAELNNVIRAWLLFGGYGSRTRRGLGSFTVITDARTWLLAGSTHEDFTRVFGRDIFAPPSMAASDTPWLAGAALQVGDAGRDAMTVWIRALDWLKDFRQGTRGSAGRRAREPGADNRPSFSNWPEADKVRHLSTPRDCLPWAHLPRHNETPAWPRAGFGLPIIGQFQQESRIPRPPGQRGPRNLKWPECKPPKTEPVGFKLGWRSHDGKEHDRLGSPLIVKALPLADGRFVPCALWLNRAYPAGQVVLQRANGSAAPFDRLVAHGDTPFFSALAGKGSLRDAFLDWLRQEYRTTVVAP